MQLILGSQSPRRKEILGYFSLPFVQIPSAFDEETVVFRGSPTDYVQELSLKKAQDLAPRFSGKIILTADTVVYKDGNIYNKPKNADKAFVMLSAFSGKAQQVFTAVTVQQDGAFFTAWEETKIYFRPLTEEQIHLYLQSASYLDKAGSYAIQGIGSLLIERIDGCYYNVMGLPINTVRDLLLNVEIDLWKHLRMQ